MQVKILLKKNNIQKCFDDNLKQVFHNFSAKVFALNDRQQRKRKLTKLLAKIISRIDFFLPK